jgi:hypothetical protein
MSRPNPGDFRVAAFGDSIMWGQGIRRRQRFTELITNQLAADVGRNPVIAHDRSRSGAQINASSKQREEFLVTFPELFTNRPQRQRFRDGDEGRATQLNGEVPATFPTISWQVDNLTDADGKTIDVALVTGGGNDIDFVSVVNPQKFPGAFIEEYDGAIRRIGHDEVLELLGRVRTKCPNAVILLIGYHKPLSYNSQANEIRALFKKESGYGDLAWWANDTFDFVDVDRMVDEARIRSEWAVGRAQHWMRQAVADACRSRAMRGPGVLFVPVQWDRTGAAFGKGESFVYDDYTHPTTDPVQAAREKAIPRADVLDDLHRAYVGVLRARPDTPGAVQAAAKLPALSGPEDLLEALQRLQQARSRPAAERARNDVVAALRREIKRIQRALIASFLHPSEAAARQYADTAVTRYREHVRLRDAIVQAERPGSGGATSSLPGEETTDQLLTRFGLRTPGASLLADVGHLRVDAIHLIVVTERASDRDLAPDIYIEVKRRGKATWVHRLNFPYGITATVNGLRLRKFYPHFEPPHTNRFTIPVTIDLMLEEITGVFLRMGNDNFAGSRVPHGTVWRPRRVELSLNGDVVRDITFRRRQVQPGDRLSLGYPPRRQVQNGGGQLAQPRRRPRRAAGR